MFLSVSIKSIIRICFYLILIVVWVTSWIKFLKEPTTFEEKVVYNKARLPSFTLCPGQINGTNSNGFHYTIQHQKSGAHCLLTALV